MSPEHAEGARLQPALVIRPRAVQAAPGRALGVVDPARQAVRLGEPGLGEGLRGHDADRRRLLHRVLQQRHRLRGVPAQGVGLTEVACDQQVDGQEVLAPANVEAALVQGDGSPEVAPAEVRQGGHGVGGGQAQRVVRLLGLAEGLGRRRGRLVELAEVAQAPRRPGARQHDAGVGAQSGPRAAAPRTGPCCAGTRRWRARSGRDSCTPGRAASGRPPRAGGRRGPRPWRGRAPPRRRPGPGDPSTTGTGSCRPQPAPAAPGRRDSRPAPPPRAPSRACAGGRRAG